MNSGGGSFSHAKGSWSSVEEETKYRFDGSRATYNILTLSSDSAFKFYTLTSFKCSVCVKWIEPEHTHCKFQLQTNLEYVIWKKGYIKVDINNQFVTKKTEQYTILHSNVCAL